MKISMKRLLSKVILTGAYLGSLYVYTFYSKPADTTGREEINDDPEFTINKDANFVNHKIKSNETIFTLSTVNDNF